MSLAPNASQPTSIAHVTDVQSGRWKLEVESTGAPAHQPGWGLDVVKLCSIDVALIDAVPTAPARTQRGE